MQHKDLEFSRLLRIKIPIPCVNCPYVQRNQLLLRLENHCWAYCVECLKLHPRKEYKRRALRQPALERCCTPYAGIVDLCPFISLTIRGRDKLIRIRKPPAKPAKTELAPFEYKVDDRGMPSLSHVFSFSTVSDYNVQVALVLFIKETRQLCVTARYTLSFSSSSAHPTAETTFDCPHRDPVSLVLGG